MINVDLLIKNKQGQTLLTWRQDRFYGPAWHIPGGIIRFKESIEDRIAKVAETELGCQVRFSAEPVNVRSMINKIAETIAEAIGNMVFKPGQKGGAPTDWPGMSMPLKLTKPKG